LDGRHATTKREVVSPEEQPLALMHNRYPKVRAVEAPLVDEGRLITAGGVSLCIDATLHLLETDAGRGGRLRNRAHPRIHDRPQR